MFTGEYRHNLDSKGRLMIPVKFRVDMQFILTRSLDGCLSMYTADEWELLEKKLVALPQTNTKARRLRRFLLGSAVSCETDKQGRILIPQVLREEAGLTKDVTLLGVGDHVEIWDTETWQEENDFSDIEELAKDMEGLGI